MLCLENAYCGPGFPNAATNDIIVLPVSCVIVFYASGGQGALFEKTAPWTPTKTFYSRSTIVPRFSKVFPIGTILFLLFLAS
jgi:hypothetical protein